MKNYTLHIKPIAEKQLIDFERAGNKQVVKKIELLFLELMEHPKTGTGQVEALKNSLSGLWSRRINKEHRMVYSINDMEVTVEVFSVKGHYY